MEEVEEGPRHCNEEISNKTDHAQPQSEPLRGAKTLEATKGAYIGAPTIEEIRSAYADLQIILKPRHVTGMGYMDPEFNELFKFWPFSIKLMWTYINTDSDLTGQWIATSLKMANNLEKGLPHAKKLCKGARAFINDCEDLPVNPYGAWTKFVIDKHPEIAQGIGKFVKSMDLIDVMDTPKMQLSSGLHD